MKTVDVSTIVGGVKSDKERCVCSICGNVAWYKTVHVECVLKREVEAGAVLTDDRINVGHLWARRTGLDVYVKAVLLNAYRTVERSCPFGMERAMRQVVTINTSEGCYQYNVSLTYDKAVWLLRQLSIGVTITLNAKYWHTV